MEINLLLFNSGAPYVLYVIELSGNNSFKSNLVDNTSFFLFIFLSAETAFWVAVGIPIALFASFGLMFLVGISINLISLFALIICLGIVVDDAIVVAEHADHRVTNLKQDPFTASKGAAVFMGLPVFTATITTILAFGALVLIGGRFGRLIADGAGDGFKPRLGDKHPVDVGSCGQLRKESLTPEGKPWIEPCRVSSPRTTGCCRRCSG